jgi:nitroreductase
MNSEVSILNDLKWRYACKRFDNQKKIDPKTVEHILEGLNLTATSLGIQLMKCVVVENQDLKDNIIPIAYGQRQVADCSHLLVLCRYIDVDEEDVEEYVTRTAYIRNLDPEDNKMQGFKRMMHSSISKDYDKRMNWLENQVYLALGNLLTICASLKIDACPMEGFIPEKVDDILNLKNYGLQSVLMCPIGYRHPDDSYANQRKVRKEVSDFVITL